MSQTSSESTSHLPGPQHRADRALAQAPAPAQEPGLDLLNWPLILSGSALTVFAVAKRRGIRQLLMVGVGAGLIYRGISPGFEKGLKRLIANTAATDPVEISASVTVARPADEVFAFWRDPENVPRYLRHIKRVEYLSPTTMRWVAAVPPDMELAWNAEITEERQGEFFAWRSVEGSELVNQGVITFRTTPEGLTEVHLRLIYQPPGGAFGARIENFFKAIPEQILREELRTFKQLVETGEIPTVRGQSYGGTITREEGIWQLSNR
ncbi:hypothetical protein DL240_02535 [Lujinxingia litoralis]|uniref:Coenzyme Q-binding protein COQ10 START domain-containing protein n=1 Tax=Lujinxingia litoralis TaxID=2211119 RepID=A0A328CBX1_9DELT|nr:SRPBCC family protein [Lujinxingia litoralis]RAL25110.1 hypothetical protein DL240_02535 [Lujinxingia litoralis]